jgi:hypothetical protein
MKLLSDARKEFEIMGKTEKKSFAFNWVAPERSIFFSPQAKRAIKNRYRKHLGMTQLFV